MSTLDDLVRTLAPQGVTRKALGQVGTLTRGRRFVRDDLRDTGTPCIHYGEVYTSYGISAKETISFLDPALASKLRVAHPGDVVIVSAGETVEDIGKAIAWLGTDDVVIHDACFAFHSDLDPRYVAYFLRTSDFRDQARPYITSSKISAISPQNLARIEIPVPPADVQREIVRILDQFTQLETELDAEWEARRRQYHHYRREVLTFPDNGEWFELQEVFITRNGYTPSKANPSLWVDGTIPWFRMEDIRTNGRVLSDAIQRVPEAAVKGGRLFPANSILVATSATIGEHALITVPHLSNQRFTSLTVSPEFADRLNVRFAHYYCFVLDEWCRDNTTISSFASVNMAAFKKFRFPVPPLERQERIVAVLDTFEDLVNDPSFGIPAERARRRTQYEYYRDELFAFTQATS